MAEFELDDRRYIPDVWFWYDMQELDLTPDLAVEVDASARVHCAASSRAVIRVRTSTNDEMPTGKVGVLGVTPSADPGLYFCR